MLAVGTAVALVRKGRVATARIGTLRTELRTAVAPNVAFDRIAAMRGKYKVDDLDANTKVLVLGAGLFMHPVFIHADGSGSRVEVGCHSKFLVMGPIRADSHHKCVNAIKAMLEP
ncbi:MAG TPA: hypothetical protein VGC41_10905 [Kofleriaceae bacterium]